MAYTLTYELINNNTEYSVTSYTGDSVDVVIPSSYNGLPVTELGSDLFGGSLTTIVLPESIKTIRSRVFEYCSSLKSVILLSRTPANISGSFYIPSDTKFYCHSSAIEAYKTAPTWNTYASRIIADDMRLYFTMNANAQKKYFASKEWVDTHPIAQVKNIINWSSDLITNQTDLSGATIKFDTSLDWSTIVFNPPHTLLLNDSNLPMFITSDGTGSKLLFVDRSSGDIVKTTLWSPNNGWELNEITLPDNFGLVSEVDVDNLMLLAPDGVLVTGDLNTKEYIDYKVENIDYSNFVTTKVYSWEELAAEEFINAQHPASDFALIFDTSKLTAWSAYGFTVIETSGGYRVRFAGGPPDLYYDTPDGKQTKIKGYDPDEKWERSHIVFPEDAGYITKVCFDANGMGFTESEFRSTAGIAIKVVPASAVALYTGISDESQTIFGEKIFNDGAYIKSLTGDTITTTGAIQTYKNLKVTDAAGSGRSYQKYSISYGGPDGKQELYFPSLTPLSVEGNGACTIATQEWTETQLNNTLKANQTNALEGFDITSTPAFKINIYSDGVNPDTPPLKSTSIGGDGIKVTGNAGMSETILDWQKLRMIDPDTINITSFNANGVKQNENNLVSWPTPYGNITDDIIATQAWTTAEITDNLSNYVTKDGAQDIKGGKRFLSSIDVNKYDPSSPNGGSFGANINIHGQVGYKMTISMLNNLYPAITSVAHNGPVNYKFDSINDSSYGETQEVASKQWVDAQFESKVGFVTDDEIVTYLGL